MIHLILFLKFTKLYLCFILIFDILIKLWYYLKYIL